MMCSFCTAVPQKSAKHASHSSSLSFWGAGRFKRTNPLNSAAQSMKEKTPFYFNLHTLAYLASQLGSPDAKAPAQRYPQAQTGKRAGQGCQFLPPSGTPGEALTPFPRATARHPSMFPPSTTSGTPRKQNLLTPVYRDKNE